MTGRRERIIAYEAHDRHHGYGEIPSCEWCAEEMGPGAERAAADDSPAERQLAELRKNIAAIAEEYQREPRWIHSDAIADLLQDWLLIGPDNEKHDERTA